MALQTMKIDFGPWEPDAAEFEGNQLVDASDVIPARRGYRPLRDFAPMQYPPLPGRVLAGFGLKNGDNLLSYAASGNSLYALEDGAWVSKHSGEALSDNRAFVDYGSSVYALFGTQLLKAEFDGATTQSFRAVEAAPRAEVMGVVRDFLVLGRLSGQPGGVQWSGLDDPEHWPAIGTDEAQFAQSDRQVFPVGGRVQAVVGGVGGVDGLVFLENAVQRMTYVGAPYIFQFDSVDRQAGLAAPRSAVVCGPYCLYLSADGWKLTDGATVRPIGVERVNRWFFDYCDSRRVSEVRGVHDPYNQLALWSFPDAHAPAGVHNMVILYNYAVDRWSCGYLRTEALYIDSPRGLTLEQLDSFGSLDALPFGSLDSPTLKDGLPGVAVFDESHTLGQLTGATRSASFGTVEFGGRRVMVHGVRPLVDSAKVRAGLLYRSRMSEGRTWLPPREVERDGVRWCHVSARYLSTDVRIPAGAAWSYATGVEVLFEPEGGI